MCGISAFLRLGKPKGTQDDSHECNCEGNKKLQCEIDQSLDIIQHRGPDARGVWISSGNKIGLGHVRLSILDLSADGNQPFHDPQGDIHAVVNGELYNHEQYRAALGNEYQFIGQSDCEIVIALYKHYGLSFISHLRGEFAFVLWDQKRNLLVAARDRFGIKSLYYTVHENRLLVATEIKSFKAFGWVPQWDVEVLRDHSWQFSPRTFFKDVYKVLPAHYITCRNFGKIEETMYWDSDFPDKTKLDPRSEDEIITGVRERMLDAVRLRLRADVPVGVYLSGGLDSSAIAGMVTHLIQHEGIRLGNDYSKDKSNLQCFTVEFDKNSGADESDIAQRTADWLGVKLHRAKMDEEALAKGFEDAVWFSESPIADLNGAGKLSLAKIVHSMGLKVVLTGEGSDEHFGGYPDFRPDLLQEEDLSWAEYRISEKDRVSGLEDLRNDRSVVAFGGDSVVAPRSTALMLNETQTGPRIAKAGELPFSSWTDEINATHPETALAESINGVVREKMAKKWHPLHTSEYVWTKSFLPTFILRYVGDNIDMVHHVESRPPFLDHEVAEYANFIPPSLKMRYNPSDKSFREKYILREAMKPFVPEEIYNRQKKPYIAPVVYSEDGYMHKTFLRLLTKENVENLGFVDWEKTKNYMDKAFKNGDPGAFRSALAVAQFVVLSQRFEVSRARSTE